ncbi:gag-pol polyprotein, partial [Trifolium medium]|nr:gag-pol polyprotein [Trifolium medium]
MCGRWYPKPKGKHIIGTRWVLRNKLNKQGEEAPNKARLVAQGYSQQGVLNAFLNDYISEEVFIHQPPGFENIKNPDFVYKLKKSWYGLKQALKA